MSTIYFMYPQWLLILPFVVVLIVLAWISKKLLIASPFVLNLERRYVYFHPRLEELRQLKAADSNIRNTGKKNLFIVIGVTVLGFLALAHPYRNGQQLPAPPEFRDVVFIVDTEVNMLLRDYIVDGNRVDRMSMVKGVLSHLAKNLKGNRMSIVLFSEQSGPLVPLTQDHQLIQAMIKRIQVGVTGRMSDPGNALLQTLKSLKQNLLLQQHSYPKNSPTSPLPKPILVLLSGVGRPVTDIDPVAAATLLKQQSLTLHTIAIGAATLEAEEKELNTLVYQPADFELLQNMAKTTGGRFVWAKNADSLSEAILEIQKAETHTGGEQQQFVKDPLYQWPLSLLLILLIIPQCQILLRGFYA
ncbi:MAG: VWA domain-containing protein [Gammaproteobacteria bacterium]|nr:VWA domain-containing protein [Gammaproteobacteria bacterium]MDH5802312.1 VWA domain-containing protein [Gammaproteobacteria bacterium]